MPYPSKESGWVNHNCAVGSRGWGLEARGPDFIGAGGTQPTLRYYDEADRDRTRGSIVLSFMPRDTFDVYFQLAAGQDEYMADEFAPVSGLARLFKVISLAAFVAPTKSSIRRGKRV